MGWYVVAYLVIAIFSWGWYYNAAAETQPSCRWTSATWVALAVMALVWPVMWLAILGFTASVWVKRIAGR